ncbi:spore germination protein [Bacillus songklensis]|uniref:Spore germination protein n=1 Tax=Bacillus songklensis TaxID=1069116 RepID=A0ABV8B5Q7_9BACI
MKLLINIHNPGVNNISQNGSFNSGQNTHNSHTANTKSVGACFSFGNFSPCFQIACNRLNNKSVMSQSGIESSQ